MSIGHFRFLRYACLALGAALVCACWAPADAGAQTLNPDPMALLAPEPSKSLRGVVEVASDTGTQPITAVAYSSDGSRLATLSLADGRLKLWDVRTRKVIEEWAPNVENTDLGTKRGGVAFQPGSNSVVGVLLDGEMYLMNLDTGEDIGPFKGAIYDFAFSVDGKWLAFAKAVPEGEEAQPGVYVDRLVMDSIFEKYDVNIDRLFVAKHDITTTHIAFSPVAEMIVVASAAADGSGTCGVTFRHFFLKDRDEDFEPISAASLAVSADGKFVLAGDKLYTINDSLGGYDRYKLKSLQGLDQEQRSKIVAATFSPEENWVAVTMGNSSIWFFDTRGGYFRGNMVVEGAKHALVTDPTGWRLATDMGVDVGFVTVTGQ